MGFGFDRLFLICFLSALKDGAQRTTFSSKSQ